MLTHPDYVRILNTEIEILKSRLEPHDTGNLHTAISVLEHRVAELNQIEHNHALKKMLDL